MHLHNMNLVKVICEKTITHSIVALFKEMGLHAYTFYDARGVGEHGVRLGGNSNTANVEVELITTEQNARLVMQRLHDDFFPNHAIIAYTMDIKVIRKEKFM